MGFSASAIKKKAISGKCKIFYEGLKFQTPSVAMSSLAEPAVAVAHARLIISGSTNPALHHHLITLYSNNPSTLHESFRVFCRLPFPPKPVSWTAVISAHSRHSPHASLQLFLSMLRHHYKLLNQGTLSCLLKTFASSCYAFGLQLHSLSLKTSLSSLPFSGSALVNFYSHHGFHNDIIKAFDEVHDKDEVCYSASIIGLAQNRQPAAAFLHFRSMLSEGIPSTMYSVSGVLRAAAIMASMERSRVVHAHAVVLGMNINVVVGTALVDAYGKAGMVCDARKVFESLGGCANAVTWNALLSAYAQQGDCWVMGSLFEGMLDRRFMPDKLTFLAVLTAFSNAGLVTETERWLKSMDKCYRVEPGLEHYTCLVGAMARVGRLAEAKKLALEMPFKADAAVWRSILCGCVVHGLVELGQSVGRQLLELNPQDDATYVMLANIYSAAGWKDEMDRVWTLMRDLGVRKERGRSWIEVRGNAHVFVAGDRTHKRTAEIYDKVKELVEAVANLGYKEEDEGLWYHSERLALAFGVVSGAAMKGKALRVVKNLRICKGCHEFFKLVTRVVEREIVVRDVNRYHSFVDGKCSCRDYW